MHVLCKLTDVCLLAAQTSLSQCGASGSVSDLYKVEVLPNTKYA